MPIKQRTIVVIPCFNEEQRFSASAFLGSILAEPELGFVLVDDGSADGTFGVLQDVEQQAPAGRVSALRLPENVGKAEAVRQGVLHAFGKAPELIGYWDADLATPLSYIARFAEQLEDEDRLLVFGSRVRLLGRHVERRPARHYVGRGFATLAALALGLPVYDTQCGAKLFRANGVMREVFSRPFELDWCFDVEMFARLIPLEAEGRVRIREQCVEYPLEEWTDTAGSKLTPRHLPSVAREMLLMLSVARRARSKSRG